MTTDITIWVGAFLTLSIFSFLYKDNPFYKFAEHLFVGISAAYWMSIGIWTTLVPNLLCRLCPGWVNSLAGSDCLCPPASLVTGYDRWIYLIPLVLGFILLMRLSPKGGWISRWSLAFIVGITAGLNIVRYIQSDFMAQVAATMITLLPGWQGLGHFFTNFSMASDGLFVTTFSAWVVFFGTFCGLIYFFFSKEHKGWFGSASRFGIWILMITFGAGFGYTVMARISLLVGRFRFLFSDWIHMVNN